MMNNNLKWLIGVLLIGTCQATTAAQTFGCLIEPYQTAEIGSQVVGIIESIKVQRGDHVKKGQLIAVLRANVERASVNAASTRAKADANAQAAAANYKFDRQRLKRAVGLLEKSFISEQALDQVRAETEVSEQKLYQAREQQKVAKRELGVAAAQLSQRTIRSPFDGVVTERYMTIGERIEEKPLVKIAQINQLRVQVIVPVAFYGKIQSGDIATVSPDFPNAPEVIGEVSLIDKVIDAASNTFRVQLELANQDYSLPAGLRCKADFGLESPIENNNTESSASNTSSYNATPLKSANTK